jgi:hypothetical protein
MVKLLSSVSVLLDALVTWAGHRSELLGAHNCHGVQGHVHQCAEMLPGNEAAFGCTLDSAAPLETGGAGLAMPSQCLHHSASSDGGANEPQDSSRHTMACRRQCAEWSFLSALRNCVRILNPQADPAANKAALDCCSGQASQQAGLRTNVTRPWQLAGPVGTASVASEPSSMAVVPSGGVPSGLPEQLWGLCAPR